MPEAPAAAALVFAVLAFALFTVPRVPVQLTSLGILAVLPLAFLAWPALAVKGEVDPRSFFFGFGHEALVAICALLILGAGLARTGALEPAVRVLEKVWNWSPAAAMLVVLVGAMAASGIVNDTPIVVLLVPVLTALATRSKTSPGKLLMPMNFAVLIGGTATTIGTSTNLLVVSLAADLGAPRFAVFDFFPLVAFAAAIALPYLWLIAPRLLPDKVEERVETRLFEAVLYLKPESKSVGAKLGDVLEKIGTRGKLLEVRRGEALSVMRLPGSQLQEGDRLLVRATAADLKELESVLDANLYNPSDLEHPIDDAHPLEKGNQVMAEIVLMDNSPLIGYTPRQVRFAERYEVMVLGAYTTDIRRTMRMRDPADHPFAVGDVLLVQGQAERIEDLRGVAGLLVLDQAIHLPRTTHAWRALAIMAGVVALAATKTLPMYLAGILGVVAMLATRCIRAENLGEALKSDVILLVASSLALARALDASGATAWLAEQVVAAVSGLPPAAIVGSMMLFVAVLTNFVSNNAAAAVGTPLAIQVAAMLGMRPEPFVLAILFGCNLCYATPIGYQTNLLVMSVARYRFLDFVKVGAPLVLLMAAALTAATAWRYGML